MAPYLLALALMMQDAPPEAAAPEAAANDGPVATAVPRKQDVAPLPIQGGAVSAPTDDYGYVGWCYGAISSYVELYDRAMPEVTRIERAWPTPSTEENLAEVYPGQREEAKRNLALFARAMDAAEKASPTAIQLQGAAAIKRGRAMWTGATSVPKAQLAQFWMSWSPPAKCEQTAKALEARSLLFGQALTYNAKGAAPVAAPPPPAEEPAPALLLASPSTEAGLSVTPEPEPEGGEPLGDPPLVAPAVEPLPTGEAEPETAPAPAADEAPADGTTDVAPSTAIDDLLPVGDPAPEAPQEAAPPPAEPTAPAESERKIGLKGPQ
ncbi:MAG: hypothetical protein Q7T19_12345 [Caulobacter sp.]|nr:hypothetical protein [Caulobacter sp.]